MMASRTPGDLSVYGFSVIDRRALRELWRFSGELAGFSAVNYWSRNADNFLIGKFVGVGGLESTAAPTTSC